MKTVWFGVVTLFPEMFQAITKYGITGRAVETGLINLEIWNPREFATDKHKTVDDRPYGGGPGMVMQVAPLRQAIQAAKAKAKTEGEKERSNEKARTGIVDEAINLEVPEVKVIYVSPQGKKLDQAAIQTLAQSAKESAKGQRLIFVAGRYEGIDERLIELEIDEEWSIGDYVLSGGELAIMVMIDAITRLIPGALGHVLSAETDSFSAGLLDYPHYTRPEEIEGLSVPKELLSGDHAAIARWRLKQSLGRTWLKRPDLLEKLDLNAESKRLLQEFIEEH